MEYTHVIGAHWHWGWIVPFLFMILMIILASRMCRRRGAWRRGAGYSGRGRFGCCQPGQNPMGHPWHETPSRIVDRRYASGEITKEQYEQMKHDLESSPSHAGSGNES